MIIYPTTEIKQDKDGNDYTEYTLHHDAVLWACAYEGDSIATDYNGLPWITPEDAPLEAGKYTSNRIPGFGATESRQELLDKIAEMNLTIPLPPSS